MPPEQLPESPLRDSLFAVVDNSFLVKLISMLEIFAALTHDQIEDLVERSERHEYLAKRSIIVEDTHGGDQIAQPAALRQAQQGASGIVIVAIKVAAAGQVAVAVVDGTAREHIKAGHEHGLKGALEHQDFKALLGIPEQRQR